MTTNVNIPASDTIVFKLNPIETTEGYFRITLWRNYCAADMANFGLTPIAYNLGGVRQPPGLQIGTISQGLPSLGMGYNNATINLNERIVTTIPIWEEEAENYFAEPTIHEFELGLYNTKDLTDITDVALAGTPLDGGSVEFGSNSSGRLLNKYLMPAPSPITYFPLPQIGMTGTDGYTPFPFVFASAGATFAPAMLGWQLLIAPIGSITSPALILTITGFRASNEVFVSSSLRDPSGPYYPTTPGAANVIWAVVGPPFQSVNQNTSIFGNYGIGAGTTYTDTTSNGGMNFTPDMQGQKILINFKPYNIVAVNSGTQLTLDAAPPTTPSYWQVIYETTGQFTTPLFGMVEFQQIGTTNWDIWMIGQASPAIEGEDKRWINAQFDNPILDERLNAPLDAEQIWDIKFGHSITSGLSQLPITPATVYLDKTNWYMPWLLGGDQATNGTGSQQHIPSLPCVYNTTVSAPDLGAYYSNGIWAGHIDWNYALQLMMDAAFGGPLNHVAPGPRMWTMTSDTSPIQVEGAKLATSWEGDAGVVLYSGFNTQTYGQRELKNWTSIDFSKANQYFLPQALWGLQNQVQGVTDGTAFSPVPRTTCWPDYLLSCWDVVEEIALCNGFLPVLSYDSLTGLPNLHFKDRTNPTGTIFSGPVPITGKPQTAEETEAGIQIVGLQTFLNNRTTDGWYDDLYAAKRGHGDKSAYGLYDIEEHFDDIDGGTTGHTDLDDTVNPRMANPYTVPGTPVKPAILKTLLRYAGFVFAWFTTSSTWDQIKGSQIEGVGVFPFFNQSTVAVPVVPNQQASNDCAWWPTLVPLIPGTAGAGAIDYRTLSHFQFQTAPTVVEAVPVIRAKFSFKNSAGKVITTLCDSLRQCLARFYSVLFVTSGNKYSVEDGTLTQFWQIDSNGDRVTTAGPSWKNIALFNERMFPDGNRYYVKRIKRDPNTMRTESDYLQIVPNQFIDNGGNFYDANEGPGGLSPGSPPNTDGPSPGGSPTT